MRIIRRLTVSIPVSSRSAGVVLIPGCIKLIKWFLWKP